MAMKKKSASQSAFFHSRVLIGFALCSIGVLLALVGLSKFVAGMSAATATAQTPGTWTATGSLNTGRFRHTATLLPNGMVLVAGGHANEAPFASAELYDPASGTWTTTGSLNT